MKRCFWMGCALCLLLVLLGWGQGFVYATAPLGADPSFLVGRESEQGLLSLGISPEEYVGLDWAGRALMLPDGGALLCDTLWGNPYALRMNAQGDVLWQVFLEDFVEDEVASGLLQDVVRMPDGRFALLFQYHGEEAAEVPDCAIVFVTEAGLPDLMLPISAVAKSLAGDESGLYAIGEESILEEEGYFAAIHLTRLALDGMVEWERQIKLDGFNTVEVIKAIWADDGLILAAMGEVTKNDGCVPLLYRLDDFERLRLVWRGNSTANAFISDLVATPEGGVVALLNEFIYDAEWSLRERKGSVYCWDGSDRLLWTVAAEREGTIDSVIRIPEGYLCASRGMDQENCPNLGEGWMLLLSPTGENLFGHSIEDLSPEGVEVWGLTTDAMGQAILYGCTLLEPGSPGAPFVARVDLSGVLSLPTEDDGRL